jgi:DNA polymerase III subunit gamma/tau
VTSTVPHQALYRRWRAQTFAQIVGQEAVVETLRNAVRSDRVSHAILFVGPRGTGKTSLARILAKAVNCTNLQDGDACDQCPSCVSIREGTTLDLIEIDAASNRGIDDVRGLRERLPYPPGQLKRKVYILDEAHQITRDAWNALLKSLEEPPDFVIFMFASTEPSGFPPAILSRLQRFDVRRLTVPEIEGKLRRILAADARAADDGAVHLIARLAAGGMRDAESMLDQLLSTAVDRIDESHVRDLLGLADADVIDAFIDHLVRGDAAAGVALLDALDERGRDVRALLDQVVEAVRAELVAGLADPARARHDPVALAAAGHRIAAIDPNRAGFGGLRFQLELALFHSSSGPSADQPSATRPAADSPVAALPVAAPPRATPAPRSTADGAATAQVPASAGASEVPAAPTPRAAVPKSTEPSPETPPARSPKKPETTVGAAPTASSAKAPESGAPTTAAPAAAAGPAAARLADTPEPAPARSGDGAPDLDRLVGGWAEVVASVGPATRAVINECRPLSVDGNIVTLGFPEAKGFLKDVAERKAKELDGAVGAFLGRPVSVRCVATNIEVSAGPPDAAYVLAEARRIFADDIVDVGEVS